VRRMLGLGNWRSRLGFAAAVTALFGLPAAAQAAVVGSHPISSYQTNGRVLAILYYDGNVYIGGKFTSVRPAGDPAGTGEVARNHIAAFNATTGALLTTWNPGASGNVTSLAGGTVGGTPTLFVGGAFAKLGTATHSRIGALNAATGAVISAFKGKLDKQVNSLAVSADGSTVYAGGAFTMADSAAHSGLAAFNSSTGSVISGWSPQAGGASSGGTPLVTTVRVSTDGATVYVGGGFTTINGASASHVDAVSASTGSQVSSFTHHLPYSVVDMSVDSTGLYIAGAGNGGNFAALDLSTGSLIWQGGTNGNVQAVTVMNGEVYIGGHYTNYCGPQGGQHTCTTPTQRLKLLAVDEGTGALTPWNPHANSNLGIFALAGNGTTLGAGGDFTTIGGVSQQGFAEFQ
jgi:PQQ-like domain